jgi:hypothetical protein
MIDALPDPWWRAAVAVSTALLDDDGATEAATRACARTEDLWAAAAEHGLSHPVLAASAEACFIAALDSLPDLGVDAATMVACEAFFERSSPGVAARPMTSSTAGAATAMGCRLHHWLRHGLIPRSTAGTISVDHHLHPDELNEALRHDVLVGLTAEAKTLTPKWFYDDRGCELFEAITAAAEYYPTHCERQILVARASEIVGVEVARSNHISRNVPSIGAHPLQGSQHHPGTVVSTCVLGTLRKQGRTLEGLPFDNG